MTKKNDLWLVRAKIPEHSGGDGDSYFVALTKTEVEAQIAALVDIADNWVQGEWDHYAATDMDDFKKLIKAEDYDGALKMWESMSDFSVSIETVSMGRTKKKLKLADMSFPPED